MGENRIFEYWGKADKDGNYHLLVYHCLDVAAVGKVWMEQSPGFVRRAANAAGLTKKAYEEWFLFFLALHDIGKFDVRFQGKVPDVLSVIQPETKPKMSICKNYNHGEAGYGWGIKESEDYFGFESDSFITWLQIVTGHHGRFSQNDTIETPPRTNPLVVKADKDSRKGFVQCMKELFASNQNIESLPEEPSKLLAGFCSICDWIGSNSEYFPLNSAFVSYKSPVDNCRDYYNSRCVNALKALTEIGVLPKLQLEGGMKALFPNYTPQGVQTIIDQLPLEQCLTIIEAHTGAGKTEAALSYASLLLSNGISETITFALPTQATTNAMLPRMEDVAPKMFKGETNLILSHGKSGFNDSFIEIKKRNYNLSKDEDCLVQCSNWLGSSKKRSFLGQIGLCTIDQVLLSVLPVKHYFVRSFGIGRSVLIVDEVHAYDNYMYGLLEEVIREQKCLGGSVILLSATLPFLQKEKLLGAWGIELDEEGALNKEPYPLITSSALEQPLALIEKEQPRQFKVFVELSYGKELSFSNELVLQIIEAAEAGAMVGIVCNIVTDAQQLALAIEEVVPSHIPVDIFHSRYRFRDRQEKEKTVVKQFGKAGKRIGRILVATQVIEQSLDIDFDWMITQLCPMDLLFQRLGRLHRHKEHQRPTGFEERKITVIVPGNELEFGNSGYVYANTLALWKTQRLLEQNDTIPFPFAYRDWIEEVYDEDDSNFSDELKKLNYSYINENEARHCTANHFTRNRDSINAIDDLSDKASSLTRDGEMSISLIPMVQNALLDGTKISELAEWEKWETLSLNAIPVPNTWRGSLLEYEEGYMKMEMLSESNGIFYAERGKYRFTYTQERGMEREEI